MTGCRSGVRHESIQTQPIFGRKKFIRRSNAQEMKARKKEYETDSWSQVFRGSDSYVMTLIHGVHDSLARHYCPWWLASRIPTG
jgi:hypothetical protein